MSTLELNFSTLTLMKSSDMFGAMENYIHAILYDGDKSISEQKTPIFKGKVVKDTPIVVNQTLRFNIPNNANKANLRLQVIVKDEDMISDDTNGKGWINLQKCGLFNGPNSYKLRLNDETKAQGQTGDINFTSNFR